MYKNPTQLGHMFSGLVCPATAHYQYLENRCWSPHSLNAAHNICDSLEQRPLRHGRIRRLPEGTRCASHSDNCFCVWSAVSQATAPGPHLAFGWTCNTFSTNEKSGRSVGFFVLPSSMANTQRRMARYVCQIDPQIASAAELGCESHRGFPVLFLLHMPTE